MEPHCELGNVCTVYINYVIGIFCFNNVEMITFRVTISVITIGGTDCKLIHLGMLADKTGGQVTEQLSSGCYIQICVIQLYKHKIMWILIFFIILYIILYLFFILFLYIILYIISSFTLKNLLSFTLNIYMFYLFNSSYRKQCFLICSIL